MPSKTFKPGEVAYHGKCRVTTKGDTVVISWMDYNGTEVKEQKSFNVKTCGNDLPLYLEEQATHYWADQIMDWIKDNTDYKQPSLVQGLWGDRQ